MPSLGSIALLVVGIAAVGAAIASCLTPWFAIQYKATILGGNCMAITEYSWDTVKTTCQQGCGSLGCPGDSSSNFLNNCDQSPTCKHVRSIYYAARGLMAFAAAVFGIGVIGYFLGMLVKAAKPFHKRFKMPLWISILGGVAALVACLVFCIGLPIATNQDYQDNTNGKNCNDNGNPSTCDRFVGQSSWSAFGSGATQNWGPGSGWILGIIASGLMFTFVALIVMCG